jgi:GT2 family glycosyltransferase
MAQPLQLSVIIPTRNRDQALQRCLTLLASQVDAAVEVIVTDDGRSVTTQAMVQSQFPFARWIAGPQRGPASNRNHGAAQARGDFLLFLDDDVEPAAELIAGYRSSLRPDVSVYEGRTTCRAGVRSPLEQAPINETGGWLWSCNMMVRRDLWESVGGFDEDFRYPHMEDVVFRERIKASGQRILFVPGATVDHPPRRMPPARVLANYNEAYFIYQYKYRDRAPSLPRFLGEFLPHRVRTVLRFRLGRDSVVALGAMGVETLHILAHWREWHRRWAPARGTAQAHAIPR